MKYLIEGADAGTGKDRTIQVEANSEADALRRAKKQGLFVSNITAISENQETESNFSINQQEIQAIVGASVSGVVLLLAVILVCSGVFSGGSSSSNKPSSPSFPSSEDDRPMALTMAQEFVRRNLKSPSSASFPWSFKEYKIIASGSGRYTVSGYVEAANSFNAQLRKNWSVEMNHSGDKWEMLSIRIDD